MQELPFTYRELLGTRSLSVQGAVLACLIALFAFIGPFGTYDSIGPLGRIGYWALTLGANWLVCASLMMLTLRVTSTAPMRTRLLAMAGAALAAAVPGTGVVHTAEASFRPDYEGHNALPTIYLGVAVLMLAISALVVSVLAGRQRYLQGKKAASGGDEAASRTVDHFLDRLPQELGRDLVYLPRNVLGSEFRLKGIVSSPIVPLPAPSRSQSRCSEFAMLSRSFLCGKSL